MTTPIRHHLDPSTLMAYSAGTLDEALAAVVASHIDLCPECSGAADDLDLFGAAVLEAFPSAGGAAVAVPESTKVPRAKIAPQSRAVGDGLPGPIAAAYGLTLASVPWKRLGPGVWHHRLALREGGQGDLRLLKIGAGRTMPDHGHGGAELTLVLDGAYSDATGEFRRGDVQDADDDIEHQPMADKDGGCICLIASERPAKFKSFLGRLSQTWTGM